MRPRSHQPPNAKNAAISEAASAPGVSGASVTACATPSALPRRTSCCADQDDDDRRASLPRSTAWPAHSRRSRSNVRSPNATMVTMATRGVRADDAPDGRQQVLRETDTEGRGQTGIHDEQRHPAVDERASLGRTPHAGRRSCRRPWETVWRARRNTARRPRSACPWPPTCRAPPRAAERSHHRRRREEDADADDLADHHRGGGPRPEKRRAVRRQVVARRIRRSRERPVAWRADLPIRRRRRPS